MIMLVNQFVCQGCHQAKPDVLVREDPYQADVMDRSVIVHTCDDCDRDCAGNI